MNFPVGFFLYFLIPYSDSASVQKKPFENNLETIRKDISEIGGGLENFTFDLLQQLFIQPLLADETTQIPPPLPTDDSRENSVQVESTPKKIAKRIALAGVGNFTTDLLKQLLQPSTSNTTLKNETESTGETTQISSPEDDKPKMPPLRKKRSTRIVGESTDVPNCQAQNIEDLREEMKKLRDLVELLRDQQKIIAVLDEQKKDLKFLAKNLTNPVENAEEVLNREEKEQLEVIQADLEEALHSLNKTRQLLKNEREKEKVIENELKNQKSDLNVLKAIITKMMKANQTSEDILGANQLHLPTFKPETVTKRKNEEIVKPRAREDDLSQLKTLLNSIGREEKSDLDSSEIQTKLLELENQLKNRRKQKTLAKLKILEREIENHPSNGEKLRELDRALKRIKPQGKSEELDLNLMDLQAAIDRLRPKQNPQSIDEIVEKLVNENQQKFTQNNDFFPPPGFTCSIDDNFFRRMTNGQIFQNYKPEANWYSSRTPQTRPNAVPNAYQNTVPRPAYQNMAPNTYQNPVPKPTYQNTVPNTYQNVVPAPSYQNVVPNSYPNQVPKPTYQNAAPNTYQNAVPTYQPVVTPNLAPPSKSIFFPAQPDSGYNQQNRLNAAQAPAANPEKPKPYSQPGPAYNNEKIADLKVQINDLQGIISNLSAQKPEDKAVVYNLETQINELRNMVNYMDRTEYRSRTKREDVSQNEQMEDFLKVLGKLVNDKHDDKYEEIVAKINNLKQQLGNEVPNAKSAYYPQPETAYYQSTPDKTKSAYYPSSDSQYYQPATTKTKLRSKSNDLFTDIISKIIDKVIDAIPVIIKKFFNFSIDELTQYGSYGADYQYQNGDLAKIFQNLGIFGFIPIILLRLLNGFGNFFRILKKNQFFKSFLLPVLILLLVTGAILFLIWWYQPDYDNYYQNDQVSGGNNINYYGETAPTYSSSYQQYSNSNYPVYKS